VVPIRPLTTAAAPLATDRLILAPPADADRETFVGFFADPEVMAVRKFGVLDRPAAEAAFDEMLAHWRDHGFGMRLVRDRADGSFLGECGLRRIEAGEVELSYGLLPAARGRGLATEAAAAVLAEGFGRLALPEVVAFARADNAVSRRVLEKLGFALAASFRDGAVVVVKYGLGPAAAGDACAGAAAG
jgi:ribosomal-protein-alanine N-acetyltransferase